MTPMGGTARLLRRRALAALPLLAAGRARAAEDTLSRVRRTGVLRFGAVPAQPPYSWRDLVDGTWHGFLPDIARDLAAELGAEATPVESGWGNGVLDIQAGKVDIFLGLAPTPEREKAVAFTHPFYRNAFALIARPGLSPRTWADLDDPAVRIAVEIGTSYDQALPGLCPRATLVRLRTNNDALLAVVAGRADCQVIVVVLALTQLARNPGLGHLVVPEPVFGATTNAIVAHEDAPRFLGAVDSWIDARRAAGDLRAALVRNLVASGVPADMVPPQLLF